MAYALINYSCFAATFVKSPGECPLSLPFAPRCLLQAAQHVARLKALMQYNPYNTTTTTTTTCQPATYPSILPLYLPPLSLSLSLPFPPSLSSPSPSLPLPPPPSPPPSNRLEASLQALQRMGGTVWLGHLCGHHVHHQLVLCTRHNRPRCYSLQDRRLPQARYVCTHVQTCVKTCVDACPDTCVDVGGWDVHGYDPGSLLDLLYCLCGWWSWLVFHVSV